MESTIAPSPVMLYTEETPNPESLKFVTNKMLYRGTADFREEALAREWSPIASALFDMPFVKGVYVTNNFVTVTKEMNYDWADIMLKIKEFIKNYVAEGGKIVHEGFAEAMAEIEAQLDAAGHNYSEEDAELVRRIRELIDTYVKPAVEMDGGNIEFKSFHNGIVTVILQGSCSGCPSSTVTLKAGIEGMLTRMIPEVKEVVSEMG
ncbi:MAG: NifU family protein [Saprospiraceae bacterium]|jgi:Fe-S cluster biogenesis protein NfuA|nr:NifU family protein [Saprospiraceae bacterium]HRD82811.1 NifU family protein [Saprospiraceae bacterium]HRJ13511.1 NifU family protein [Saprospiraceae bacterium]HRK81893.1 NifU family protein [Saprospiraceae bacterium]